MKVVLGGGYEGWHMAGQCDDVPVHRRMVAAMGLSFHAAYVDR